MHSQDIKPSNVIHRGSDIIFTDFSSSSRFEIGPTTSTENPARTSAIYGLRSLFEISLMALQKTRPWKWHFFPGSYICRNAYPHRQTSRFRLSRLRHCQERSHFTWLQRTKWLDFVRTPNILRGPWPRKWWFMESHKEGHGFFEHCIRPMLATKREDRPQVSVVFGDLQNQQHLLVVVDCLCYRKPTPTPRTLPHRPRPRTLTALLVQQESAQRSIMWILSKHGLDTPLVSETFAISVWLCMDSLCG